MKWHPCHIDILTATLRIHLQKWPNDVKTASEWNASLPHRHRLTGATTPAKVKLRLNRLAANGLVKRTEHRNPATGKVKVYYQCGDS